jgi:hypothetical protein
MGGGRGRFRRPLKKFPAREKKKKFPARARNRALPAMEKKKAIMPETRKILDIFRDSRR